MRFFKRYSAFFLFWRFALPQFCLSAGFFVDCGACGGISVGLILPKADFVTNHFKLVF